MKVFKKFALLVFLFIVYFVICASNYANAVTQDISDSIFRLHVIANSDSVEDQNLKYKVRDNVLKYMNSITDDISSKEKIITVISSHLNEFKNIAQNTVYESGFNYNITIEVGNFEFPTKTYGDISFPPRIL